MPSNKKILIITYYWPPCGGAGVQRWLKFAKYLPEYGWEPFVLTVDPEYAEYPAIDESLEEDINPELKVYKTKALNYFFLGYGRKSKSEAGSVTLSNNGILGRIARFIRGNFFIPDPRKGWNRYAVRKASELISTAKINYVVTTSPPHSTQLIGLKLKSIFPAIKWICDLRDPWTDIYYYNKFYGTWPARLYDRKLEKRVLKRAGKIITVGQSLASLFLSKLEDKEKQLSVITNGYDDEDFRNIKIKNDPQKLVITYVGTLSDQYPVETVISVLSSLKNRNIDYEFNLVGQSPAAIKSAMFSKLDHDSVNFIQYLSHEAAIKYMSASSVLLLLIPDYQGNKLIITGKLFEYLRTGIPILLIGPEDGDAALIIKECSAGRSFDKRDIVDITDFISKGTDEIRYKIPVKYRRRLLTGRLAEEIKDI